MHLLEIYVAFNSELMKVEARCRVWKTTDPCDEKLQYKNLSNWKKSC